jgi:hypothetical protein
MDKCRHGRARRSLALCFGALVLSGGCASVPKPVGEVASAQTAVGGAEASDAQRFAPVELDRARSKLARAQKAMEKGRNLEARHLAEEALADAKLAGARAEAERAKQAAREMEASVQILREEIERARRSDQTE